MQRVIGFEEEKKESFLEELEECGIFKVIERLTADEIIEMTEAYSAHNYGPLPVVIDRADGAKVWDKNGKEYIDLIGCYSAVGHGHRNRRIIRVAMKQMEKLLNTGRPVYNAEMGVLMKALCEYTKMDIALPMNTGAEAVETALKAARRWGYRVKGVPQDQAEIIAAVGNFHGRTITIIGFSTEEAYRKDFGPFTPGFKIIPFDDLTALEAAITANTVAFLVEPIQAEGGVIVPEEGYLTEVRKICDRHKVLLIVDEIQTGFARTGKDFAHQWDEIKPDLMTLGKALGGGLVPISAVVGKKEVMSMFDPGSHGSTFGGNPFASCIAVEAILEAIREKLAQRALESGKKIMDALKGLNSPYVKEIRGKGLLIGVEFKQEAGTGHDFAMKLLKLGIITKDTHKQTIRITPPLTISEEEISIALEKLKLVLQK